MNEHSGVIGEGALDRSDPLFPIDRLPHKLRTYVATLVQKTGYHMDYLAPHSFLALASITGTKFCLDVNGEWNEYPSFFFCGVGPSGCGKSHPLGRAFQQAIKIDAERNRAYAENLKRYRNKGIDAAGQKTPELNDLIAVDATMESVLDTLSKNPKGLVVLRDELTGFFDDLYRYRPGSDENTYLSLWSQKSTKVSRKGKEEHLIIPTPCISIFGTMQPDRLDLFDQKKRLQSGLTTRFLFAFPQNLKAMRPSKTKVDAGLLESYDVLMRRAIESRDDGGQTLRVTLSKEADDYFMRFLHESADKIDDEERDIYKQIYSKGRNHAARIILALHIAYCLEDDTYDRDTIGIQVVVDGLKIAEWFQNQSFCVIEHIVAMKVNKRDASFVTDIEQLKADQASGLSIREMAAKHGISKSRVHQVLTRY